MTSSKVNVRYDYPYFYINFPCQKENQLNKISWEWGSYPGCCAFTVFRNFQLNNRNQDYISEFGAIFDSLYKPLSENYSEIVKASKNTSIVSALDKGKYSVLYITLSEFDSNMNNFNKWLLGFFKDSFDFNFIPLVNGKSRFANYGITQYAHFIEPPKKSLVGKVSKLYPKENIFTNLEKVKSNG